MSEAVVGVDLGSKRIGVSISESPALPAMPLGTLAYSGREASAAAIAALARERGARTIVVGYPLRLDGTPGPAAERTDAFVAALKTIFDGEVVTVDERLTTKAAGARLRERELRPSRRRLVVDALAAVEILETYRARTKHR